LGSLNALLSDKSKNFDIRTIDIDNLVDIRTVKIDPHQPKDERIRSFIRQVHNPYCYRVGKIAVKISFTETETTLEDKLVSLLAKC